LIVASAGAASAAADEPAGPGVLADAHLIVLVGSNEASDDLDQWVQALDRQRQEGSRQS
jgi:hypothetical protein